MKASKKRSLFLLTAACCLGLGAIVLSNLNPLNAIYADNVSYGMTFNSSKNKTPLCAREIAPGCILTPPPTNAAFDIVWCGLRKGLPVINGFSAFNKPATL